MLRFLCKRILGAFAVLAAVSLLTFVLLDLAPGDAAQALAGEGASAEQLAELRHAMGLDRSPLVRYGRFVGNLVTHGDLGRSLVNGRPVSALVVERFRHTLELTLVAVALALAVGGLAGWLAARRPGGLMDAGIMAATGLGLSLPSFWVAMLLVLVFALWLRWLPVVGAGRPAHLVLPAISLALPTAAVIGRLVRSSLLDVKDAEYVRVAHAKGLSPALVWRRHILPNGLMPVITVLGLHLGHLLGGTFVVETIFAWPGLGRLVVQAVFDRDYPVIVGVVILMALIYQALNLAVDLAHAWLDPRVAGQSL